MEGKPGLFKRIRFTFASVRSSVKALWRYASTCRSREATQKVGWLEMGGTETKEEEREKK